MQNSSDMGAKRPVILYIIIAVALFAALILTVRWAKMRADYYGQQQTGQGQTVATTEESQPQGTSEESQPADSSHQQSPQQSPAASSHQESTTNTQNPQSVASTGAPAVHSVPATGPEQL